MRLNITNLKSKDYGEYNCIAKNEIGIAKGVFYLQSMFRLERHFVQNIDLLFLYLLDNDNSIIRPIKEGSHPMAFGNNPPESKSYEDLCPPTTCPECLDPK